MIALWLGLALAHPLSPSVLVLEQTTDGVQARWREPAMQPVGGTLVPVLPCPTTGTPSQVRKDGVVETRWNLACDALAGREVAVTGLDSGRNAMVEWTGPSGTRTELLHAGRDRVVLDTHPPVRGGLAAAARVGVEHLMAGADHLLFLFGLVLLLPARGLVAPVTAFTAGHALSLAAVGTGLLVLPSAPIEVAIALSLVWLAAELATAARGWIAAHPVRLCTGFGLLHGLGFAGAWREAGLGDGGLLLGLLGFNVGVELAQLVVVGLCIGSLALVGRPEGWARTGMAWVGGTLASIWVWERAATALLS